MASGRRKEGMSRFFASVSEGFATVTGEEAAHMVKTLRMQKGDAFTAIDNSGFEYRCEIEGMTQQEVRARVLEKTLCRAEPRMRLTLYQAYPKAAKMETILQKCVEIGITGFVPFISERCVKKPEKDDVNKLSRLRRVAAEAVKQCGRAVTPGVSDILSFKQVLQKLPGHGLVLLAWEEERAATLKQALKNSPDAKDVALIIGSEGGFSAGEAEDMKKAGAVSVSLGSRILRTETAGMAASAMIAYELEE